MKAFLKNYRQSPRKVRLVADLVKGKKVGTAFVELEFLSKRASDPIRGLIKSAVANAKQNDGIEAEDLIVKSITVDKGRVLKRFRPVSRGRAFQIQKKMSHVEVTLAVKPSKVKNKKSDK